MSHARCDILIDVASRGCWLRLVGDANVRVEGPTGFIDDGLVRFLREHKRELVDTLRLPSIWCRAAAAILSEVDFDQTRIDLRGAFEERAGIAEYHGNMERLEAERFAFCELVKAVRETLKERNGN